MLSRKTGIMAGLLIVFTATGAWHFYGASRGEAWPQPFIPEVAAVKVEHQQRIWASRHYSFDRWNQPYESAGDYFGYATICEPRNESRMTDADGILMYANDNGSHYHPVVLALCGLKAYGLWLKDDDPQHLDVAFQYAEKLIEIQRNDGAFPYNFTRAFYVTGETRGPGWTSAMAQGQAISLLSRLYRATGDETLITPGKKALEYLLTPKQDGGVMTDMSDLHPSLSDYVFFLETVHYPDNYTLNGYMFALLGLYDWSTLPESVDANQKLAREYFSQGNQTLENILPYFEMGGITSYDLTHLTYDNRENLFVTASYTGVHVYCLYALHSITGNPVFDQYRRKWHENLNEARLNATPFD